MMGACCQSSGENVEPSSVWMRPVGMSDVLRGEIASPEWWSAAGTSSSWSLNGENLLVVVVGGHALEVEQRSLNLEHAVVHTL